MTYNKSVLTTQRVIQNSQEFLLGVFTIEQILKFTRYTEYTILGFDEENDNKPITRKEVQRKLNPSKVNSIVNFLLNDPLAIFPTNLVISIPNHVIEHQYEHNENSRLIDIHLKQIVFDEIEKRDRNKQGEIYLSVIDGQHRVRGIEKTIMFLEDKISTNLKLSRTINDKTKILKEVESDRKKLEKLSKIELPVTFFIDPQLEYQAMIFSTINRTQTKVPPSLVYSLFGISKKDSPQKTLLNIVNTLNGRENSPFYKRIKLAGSSSKEAKDFYLDGNPILSQATIIKYLLKMICTNKTEEENARHFSRSYFIDNPNRDLPFRKYYGKDDDARIIRILFSYFTAIRTGFTDDKGISYWNFTDGDSRKASNILQTTVGFISLLDVFSRMLSEVKEENNDKIETYLSYINKVKDLDINNINRYSFNNRGKKFLYLDMSLAIWPSNHLKDPKDKRLQELKELGQNK